MVDTKLTTLLTLAQLRSFTVAAKELSLTQPAVSHHIRQLEEEFGIQVFYRGAKEFKLTPEGNILLKYARRACVLYENTKQAIEDQHRDMRRFAIGVTPSAEEIFIPQVVAAYCGEHPETHIQIVSDSIKNLHDRLKNFEIDIAIVEGNMTDASLKSVLLDTDYLCLIVSPHHPFAERPGVTLGELRKEKLVLRSKNAGTRRLFESYLLNNMDHIRNYNVVIESDNIATVRELVCLGMGVSIMAHSACRAAEQAGEIKVVPIENCHMVREINMVYHRDFDHPEVFEAVRKIYHQLF